MVRLAERSSARWTSTRRILLAVLLLLFLPSSFGQLQDATTPAITRTIIFANASPTSTHSSSVPDFSAIVSAVEALPSAVAAAAPPCLDTRIDAPFGVLGALLIISGLALAFWGTRNRWSSVFLIGAYSGALVISLLILKLGVVNAVNPPSQTVRGLFLLASLVGGIICGVLSVVWWKGAQFLAGALGGFSVGLFILALRSNTLIRPVGLRYVLLSCLSAIGFVLATLPKLLPSTLLLATSAIGSTGIVLGVDCFTTFGLKEFYLWNLGFAALFPKLDGEYTLSLGIQIELGVMAALFLVASGWQHRGFAALRERAASLKAARRSRVAEDAGSGDRARLEEGHREHWEKLQGLESPSAATLLHQNPLDLLRVDTPSSMNGQRLKKGRSGAPDDLITPTPRPTLRPSSSTPLDRPPNYPSSLTFPVDSPLPRTSSSPRLPTRPSSLAIPRQAEFSLINGDPRRHTLIDFAGVVAPDRSRKEGQERILVGDWSPKPKLPPAPARIMDFSELEEKHRRRMSQLQAEAKPVPDVAPSTTPNPTLQMSIDTKSSRRRSSGDLLVKPPPSPSLPSSNPLSPTTKDPSRRRSLGNPLDFSTIDPIPRSRAPPVEQRRESQRLSQTMAEGRSRAVLRPETPEIVELKSPGVQAAAKEKKGKHSWLGY